MKVTIRGTKADDKTVRLETQILETLTPETIKKTDASLAPGRPRSSRPQPPATRPSPISMFTVNGETTKEVANRSSYRKRDKIILVGPEASKSEPAASTGTSSTQSSASTDTGSAASGSSGGSGAGSSDRRAE